MSSQTAPPITLRWFSPSASRTTATASLLGLPLLFAHGRPLARAAATHAPAAPGHPRASLVFGALAATPQQWWRASAVVRLPPAQLFDVALVGDNVLGRDVLKAATDADVRLVVEVCWRRFLVCIVGRDERVFEIPRGVGLGGRGLWGREEGLHVCVDGGSRVGDRAGRQVRATLFGQNAINAPVRPLVLLLIDALVHPFFLFQLAACGLWVAEEYVLYAAAILLTSLAGAALEARELHASASRLAALANPPRSCDGEDEPDVERLTPGDVLRVRWGAVVPADCTLVSGTAVCGEAALTGEAAPVRKYAWDGRVGDGGCDAPSVALYAGTSVLAATSDARAVVTRVGAATDRGLLVREILVDNLGVPVLSIGTSRASPGVGSGADGVGGGTGGGDRQGIGHDVYSALWIMFVVGICGAVWSAMRLLHTFGLSLYDAVIESLDLVTIAVPPALPAAVSFGLAFAMARLRAAKTSCLRAAAVPLAGESEIVCFDKTGTLTSQGLSLHSVYQVVRGEYVCATSQHGRSGGNENGFDQSARVAGGICAQFRRALACCHTLSHVNGKIVGDEVDMCLFRLSQSTLHDVLPGDSGLFTVEESDEALSIEHPIPVQATVTRILDFSSALGRQGAVASVQASGGPGPGTGPTGPPLQVVYVKGAPESVLDLCKHDSIPEQSPMFVRRECAEGRRVLAVAYRVVPASSRIDCLSAPRAALETEMTLLGLVAMENPVKPAAQFVVSTVAAAGMRPLICSGDHLDTCIAVARSSGMVFEDDRIVRVACVDTLDTAEDVSVTVSANGLSFPSVTEAVHYLRALGDFQESPNSRVTIAVTGSAMDALLREDSDDARGSEGCLDLVLRLGVVFARMSPFQKRELVCLLKSRESGRTYQQAGSSGDSSVMFVGDGANDIGALRAASAGVAVVGGDENGDEAAGSSTGGGHWPRGSRASLPVPAGFLLGERRKRFESAWYSSVNRTDETDDVIVGEASLGAPFTSHVGIRGVLQVVRQGRAARVASISAVLYLIVYSAIQFCSVVLLYSVGRFKLSDGQFLLGDLGIVMPLAVAMGRTDAAATLHHTAPPRRISSAHLLRTLFGLIAIQLAAQLCVLAAVAPSDAIQDTARAAKSGLLSKSRAGTAVFLLSAAQYVASAAACQLGVARQHRAPLRESGAAAAALCVGSAVCVLLLHVAADPEEWRLGRGLEMAPLALGTRCYVGVVAVIACAVTVGFARAAGAG